MPTQLREVQQAKEYLNCGVGMELVVCVGGMFSSCSGGNNTYTRNYWLERVLSLLTSYKLLLFTAKLLPVGAPPSSTRLLKIHSVCSVV